jgi:hypothetical protein
VQHFKLGGLNRALSENPCLGLAAVFEGRDFCGRFEQTRQQKLAGRRRCALIAGRPPGHRHRRAPRVHKSFEKEAPRRGRTRQGPTGFLTDSNCESGCGSSLQNVARRAKRCRNAFKIGTRACYFGDETFSRTFEAHTSFGHSSHLNDEKVLLHWLRIGLVRRLRPRFAPRLTTALRSTRSRLEIRRAN